MSKSVEKGELLDHLLCPVCFEVPEAEVYQCRDGHMVCHKCYFKCVHCPQCRDAFDFARPIRCRPFEEILARLKLNCPFKSKGCKVEISKENFKSHSSECYYDFEKFGKLVHLCKGIGYTECIGGINNGNTEAAVDHFVSKHKCTLTNSEVFKMDLKFFDTYWGSYVCCFWTPVIADLKDQKCFIMTVAILSGDNTGFTLLPIFLPYLANNDRKTCPVQVEYTLQTNDCLDGEILTTKPVSISQANEMMTNQKLRFIYNSKALRSNCSKYGTLSFKCQIRPVGVFSTGKNAELESFECVPHFKTIETTAASKAKGFNFGSTSAQSLDSKTEFKKSFLFTNFNASKVNCENVPAFGETLKTTAINTSQDKSKLTDVSTTSSVFGYKHVSVSKEVASPVKPLSLDKDKDEGS